MDVAVVDVAVRFVPTISPTTESFAYGDVEPIPSLLFVLSQKNAASAANVPPLLN